MNKFKVGDIVYGIPKAIEKYPELQGEHEVTFTSLNVIRITNDSTNSSWDHSWFTSVKNYMGVKHDSGKLRYSLIPWITLKEVVKVLEFGAAKYSINNWQKINPQRYKDAAMRHLIAIFEGEWLDEESQLPHAAHCICCLLFILWFKLNE